MLVSLEAIILTGMVLMTQNRMTRQAEKRAHLDLQVNLLAEQELTTMLQMLTALCERMEVAVPAHDARVAQLVKETDIHELASALDGSSPRRRLARAFVSASTAYAVAASFMKRPASDAGSRCLFSDVANHTPVAGS